MSSFGFNETPTPIEPTAEVAAWLEPGENLLHTQDQVTLAATSADGEPAPAAVRGVGTLHVTSSRVVWEPNDPSVGAGRFEYHASKLTMHAISRQGGTGWGPCIYCQLDEGTDAGDDGEAYYAPSNHAALPDCFRAFSGTAILNPPPDEDEDEHMMGDGGGDGMMSAMMGGGNRTGMSPDQMFTAADFGAADADASDAMEEAAADADADGEGAGDNGMVAVVGAGAGDEGGASEEERAAMLARLDSLLVVPEKYQTQEGQFDDGEDDGEEGGEGSGMSNGR